MPAFLPFLLVAAAVIAIGSGSTSGWRTQAQMAEGEGAAPPVHGSVDTRWFFWWIHYPAFPYQGQIAPYGPQYVTDDQAFNYEVRMEMEYLGVELHRFVWTGVRWVRDTRNHPDLMASAPIPGTVGAIALTQPVKGTWPYATLPLQITLGGRLFKKAKFLTQKTGVVGQYREAVPANSMHLYVLYDGTYLATHLDEANPDMGHALGHLLKDVIKPMAVA